MSLGTEAGNDAADKCEILGLYIAVYIRDTNSQSRRSFSERLINNNGCVLFQIDLHLSNEIDPVR